jgi:hypothetical protein
MSSLIFFKKTAQSAYILGFNTRLLALTFCFYIACVIKQHFSAAFRVYQFARYTHPLVH